MLRTVRISEPRRLVLCKPPSNRDTVPETRDAARLRSVNYAQIGQPNGRSGRDSVSSPYFSELDNDRGGRLVIRSGGGTLAGRDEGAHRELIVALSAIRTYVSWYSGYALGGKRRDAVDVISPRRKSERRALVTGATSCAA
jgi:hypothetical protein